jgi:uncharacterized protein YkwD
VARLRLSVAVLTVLCVLASVAGPALAAPKVPHTRAHRAGRCGRAARSHSRKARGKSAKRHGCVRRHAAHFKPAGTHARSRSADDGCPNAALQPTDHDLESIRVATLCLINRERTARGESALLANAQVQQAAQGHTESMVQDDYFGHVGPQGETLLQRMHASGYLYSSQISCEVAENIAWGTLWLGTPKAIVAAWMASPGHRANILDAKFRDTGVGVSPHPPASVSGGQSGGIYTQDFGVIVG